MRLSASEFILFCNPPVENVKLLSKIVPEVELMLDGDAWDYETEGWPEQAAALKDLGIPFTVHPPAWDVNAAAPIRALRDAATILNKAAVKLCHEIGGNQIVFHPGYYDSASFFSKTRAQGFCYSLLDEMVSLCKPLGITIAFENVAGPSMTLFNQQEFIHALDGIDPCVKFLLDIGHAHCNQWNIPEVINRIGDRLCAFHLHDNNGNGDSHLPIGHGSIEWESVFAAMRQLPKDILYVMEYASGTPLSALEEGRDLLLLKVDS